MTAFRFKDLLGPAALALAVVTAVGVLRGLDPVSSAHAGTDDSFRGTVLRDAALVRAPGARASGDPVPAFLNAGSQRVEQLDVMREVLRELRAIRGLIESGEARVNVAAVELDYDRLSDAVSRAMPAARTGADAGRAGGGVRRLTNGSTDAGGSEGR